MSVRTAGLAATLFLLVAGAANAASLHFTAQLRGADEVPPNSSSGTGEVSADLDTATKTFSYMVTFSGLSGPAMAAHFHGPAAPGANAPPIIPLMKPVSPAKGTAPLTDAQIADLEAGKWYFNIHTMAHPGGEIRGQLEQKP